MVCIAISTALQFLFSKKCYMKIVTAFKQRQINQTGDENRATFSPSSSFQTDCRNLLYHEKAA
jgi:hypothetical protein